VDRVAIRAVRSTVASRILVKQTREFFLQPFVEAVARHEAAASATPPGGVRDTLEGLAASGA